MGKTQERAARVMADTDLLADLNKVRKVRADVEQVIPLSVIDLICQKLDIYGLQDPRGRRFQVFKEDIADHIVSIENFPLGSGVQAQVRIDPVL